MSNSDETLVVYFSASGNTKTAAETIGKKLSATVVAIQPATPYPEAYEDLAAVGKQEIDQQCLPDLAPLPFNLKAYQTIYIGFPVWWDQPPMLIASFLQNPALVGKKLIFFATSYSSTIDKSQQVLTDWTKETSLEMKASFLANNQDEIVTALAKLNN